MKWILSDVALAIWIALDDPSKWEFGPNRAIHKPSNVQLWTGNGAVFFDLYESPLSIGILERWIVYGKLRRIARRQLVATFYTSLIGEKP